MYEVQLKEVLDESGIKTTQYYEKTDYLALPELAEALEGDPDRAEIFLKHYYELYGENTLIQADEKEILTFFDLMLEELKHNELLVQQFKELYETKITKLRALQREYTKYYLNKYKNVLRKWSYFTVLCSLSEIGEVDKELTSEFDTLFGTHEYQIDDADNKWLAQDRGEVFLRRSELPHEIDFGDKIIFADDQQKVYRVTKIDNFNMFIVLFIENPKKFEQLPECGPDEELKEIVERKGINTENFREFVSLKLKRL